MAILSDQRMPGYSGHQFLARAREITGATRILITGYSDIDAVVSAINRGKIFGYISKPWQPERLRELVHQACDHYETVQALEEEQRLLGNLLDNVPDGIYFTDREHRFLRANRAYARAFGVSEPARLIAQTAHDLLEEKQANAIEAEEEGIMATGITIADALVSRRAEDGTRQWLSKTKAPIEGSHGDVVGLVAVIRDVTKRKQAEEALQASRARAQAVVESALDAFIMIDASGSIIDWNPQAEATFRWPRAEILGRSFSEVLLPERYQDEFLRMQEVLLAGCAADEPTGVLRGERLEWSARDRDGREFPVEIALNTFADPSGPVLSAFVRDITERKEQEARIVRLTRIYAVLSSINAAIIRVTDRDQLFADVSHIVLDAGRFAAVWIGLLDAEAAGIRPVASAGIELASLVTLPVVSGDGGGDYDDVNLLMRALQQRETAACNELRRVSVRGGDANYNSAIALPLRINDVPIGAVMLYAWERDFFDDQEVGLLREMAGNISFALDHLSKEERLNYLAFYDGLTGLSNRTLFADRLAQQIQASTQDGRLLALLLIDLERFRNVNETLGLSAGDTLLKGVAERLEHGGIPRENLSRMSSDCFAVALGDVKSEAEVAHFVRQQILPCFERPFALAGHDVHISAVVGISLFPDDGTTAESLFASAEIVLKMAKSSAERFLFYAPGMNTRIANELHLETKLRKALEADQFVLHYQPKIDLRSGRITGLEALIRWQDPSVGLVPPAAFIGLLEATGMIIDVGMWALERAASDYGIWLEHGLRPPRIAVNVSPIQLRHRNFVASISRLMDTCKHAVECLDLEITESVLMEDIQSNIETLQKIKEYGVKISVDDFGTGYSSLAYIGKLPIDYLKIDRLFIKDITENPDDLTIVTTIISLGHSLNLRVIAEGVETEEQAKFLRLLRCDEMQGYLFSRPLPAEGIEGLLRNESR